MLKIETILLKRQEIRETSLIVTAMSRELGKIQGVVKGVRGARAAVPWVLEPLTHQALIFYERRRSSIGLISAFDLIHPFDAIRRDFVRTAYASFCLDLTEAMTEFGQKQSDLFELLLGSLRALEQQADGRCLIRYFEAHLLKASGILPEIRSLGLSPGGKLSLGQILQTPLDRLSRLRLTRPVEDELGAKLASLTRNTLGRELKSRNFLFLVGLENVYSPAVGVPLGTSAGRAGMVPPDSERFGRARPRIERVRHAGADERCP